LCSISIHLIDSIFYYLFYFSFTITFSIFHFLFEALKILFKGNKSARQNKKKKNLLFVKVGKSRCEGNERIMNPRYNKKICCTVRHNIKNTNSSIKMIFPIKLITSYKRNQNMYQKSKHKKNYKHNKTNHLPLTWPTLIFS
jgi:hypothetical protein